MTNRDVTLKDVYDIVNRLESKMDNDFVHKEEFAPYKAALNVAGVVILTALVGAFIYLIARNPVALLAG
jgi:hypothetical protein